MTDETERRVVDVSTDGLSRDIESSLDTVFRVISNQTRRFALYALQDVADGVVDLEALIDEVATLIVGLETQPITRDRYMEIASDLYYWHLPVLADVGVIDYDTRQDTVRYLSSPTLEKWVKRARTDEFDG